MGAGWAPEPIWALWKREKSVTGVYYSRNFRPFRGEIMECGREITRLRAQLLTNVDCQSKCLLVTVGLPPRNVPNQVLLG